MTFHDGKPVTVEDAKFTFDYIKKWKFPLYARVWKNVDSVTIMDARRVRFKLSRLYAPFVNNVLLDQFILPKHIWEKIPGSVGIANPMDWSNPMPIIGSGPYQFVEWKKGEYTHLKAHKKHWMAPNFDGMWVIVAPTIGGMLAMLEQEKAEIMGWYVDPKSGEQLAALPHLKMVTADGAGRYELRPNLKMKPMSDPMFRQAFQHAINRKGINDVIYGGRGTECPNTPIPVYNKYWNNPDIPVMEFNLGKAREILKAAGYTWDKKGRLCYPE